MNALSLESLARNRGSVYCVSANVYLIRKVSRRQCMAKNLFSWQAYLWLCKLENNVLVTSMRVEQTENPILQKKKY